MWKREIEIEIVVLKSTELNSNHHTQNCADRQKQASGTHKLTNKHTDELVHAHSPATAAVLLPPSGALFAELRAPAGLSRRRRGTGAVLSGPGRGAGAVGALDVSQDINVLRPAAAAAAAHQGDDPGPPHGPGREERWEKYRGRWRGRLLRAEHAQQP